MARTKTVSIQHLYWHRPIKPYIQRSLQSDKSFQVFNRTVFFVLSFFFSLSLSLAVAARLFDSSFISILLSRGLSFNTRTIATGGQLLNAAHLSTSQNVANGLSAQCIAFDIQKCFKYCHYKIKLTRSWMKLNAIVMLAVVCF